MSQTIRNLAQLQKAAEKQCYYLADKVADKVKENAKEYTMEIAVPGIKKEYCRININENGNLDIAIENKLEHKDENKKEHYLRREFSYTNYQQSYVLPDNVEKENISAKKEDAT